MQRLGIEDRYERRTQIRSRTVERPPRYDQVRRWAEYIQAHPPEVWGPQQNTVVNGQVESARTAGVGAADRERIRRFADEVLRAEADDDGGLDDGTYVGQYASPVRIRVGPGRPTRPLFTRRTPVFGRSTVRRPFRRYRVVRPS